MMMSTPQSSCPRASRAVYSRLVCSCPSITRLTVESALAFDNKTAVVELTGSVINYR